MMKKRIKHLVSYLKSLDYNSRGLLALFILMLIVSLLVRATLVGAQTFDYTYFLEPWITHLRERGLAALGDNFSNYNAPYLILLWVVSHLPFSDIHDIKILSITFDYVLASGVFLVVRHYRPKGLAPYVAFLAIVFAPTVLQNSSLWGQCDAIYTAFIVFAFYAYLKGKINLSWILWGVAFSFKLQGMFFLPVLLFLTLYSRRSLFRGPILAALTVIILSSPPLLFGKSVLDIIHIYVSQTAPPMGVEMLSWFSPTVYQFMSNEYFPYIRKAGILLGGTVALAVVALAFARRYNKVTLLAIVTFGLLVVPYFLPQIHERYLFTGEIFLIIMACVVPRFIAAAIGMQIITTMAYITYFTGANQMPPLPFAWLSLGVLVILFFYARYIYRTSKQLKIKAIN